MPAGKPPPVATPPVDRVASVRQPPRRATVPELTSSDLDQDSGAAIPGAIAGALLCNEALWPRVDDQCGAAKQGRERTTWHATVAFTMQVCAHVIPGMQAGAAAAFGELVFGDDDAAT